MRCKNRLWLDFFDFVNLNYKRQKSLAQSLIRIYDVYNNRGAANCSDKAMKKKSIQCLFPLIVAGSSCLFPVVIGQQMFILSKFHP